ncbi:MAG: site-specific integrase [Paludibacter sp.]|jgi:integrase|nr:site-specific integrase [Paludibacter sp.]
MANKKTTTELKAKEPIKIRFKKLANGNQSIYLDYYREGQRKYDFLKLYLLPATNTANRTKNADTLQLAKAIQAKKIVELQNNIHGFSNSGTRLKVNVIDYIEKLAEKKREKAGGNSRGNCQNYLALAYHIQKYSGDKLTFKSVDKRFCEGFLEYLKTAERTNAWGDHFPLNPNTQFGYMKKFETVLNTAIADEIITVNPFRHIKQENKPKKHRAEVCYLTEEELKMLDNTPMKPPVIKQAFLFSCYTGLRFSDVTRLTWDKLQKDNNGDTLISFVQKKTDKQEYLPIAKKALNYLPERNAAKANDIVFKLPTNKFTNVVLRNWTCAVGITKKVTFHVARHTYATLLLTLEVPIEVVSKNLGHADIQTTQIYAKVVNAAQRAAVSKLDTL